MEQVMSPKSPLPGLVDFHGKRKQMAKIQVLEREIGLLQEELKSLEGLHPASRCCNERKHTTSGSYHFGKKISLPWICCSCRCLLHKKMAKGCFCSCCSSSSSGCSGRRSCLKSTSTVSKIVAKF